MFEALAEPGFDALPRDANWLIALTLLAEVCGALGDAERARELYALLEPTRAQRDRGARGDVQRLRVAPAGDARGRARRVGRGRAALRRGARDARPDGRAAVAGADRAGVGRDAARARPSPATTCAARELLADAIVIADALGMVVLAERARALVAGGEPLRSAP